MCIKNVAAAAIMLAALFVHVSCKPKHHESFETVYAKVGGGIAFIPKTTAKRMKHAFDVLHRNARFYFPDGTEKPGAPATDPANDGDIIYTDPRANDTLSTAVWINKDVIDYLADLLEDDDNNCDGVRIYFASYDSMMGVPGQRKGNQSTVFMVPTNPNSSGHPHHTDNYGLVQQLLDQLSAATKAKFQAKDGALNHGELCPSDCN